MTKISTLTPAQWDRVQTYREECREKALRPHWASDDEMRQAVIDLYRAAGQKEPVVWVFADPVQCLCWRAILRNQLGGQLWDQLRNQLSKAHDPLWLAGGSEFYWISLYRFCERIGVALTEAQSTWLSAWEAYATICGPLYPYDGHAFVSRRPDALRFDDQQRLHSETGPAMSFASGYAIHSWHGTRVPAQWIEDKANVEAAEVLGTQDANVRSAGIQALGWDRLICELGAQVVDRHPEGMLGGELLAVDKRKIDAEVRGTIKLLRAECPRNGTICFRVPDETKTAHEAQAWSRGLPPEIFQLPSTRT